MFDINHFHKAYGNKIIFEDVRALFDGPCPVMIVGEKDSGKTVLLRCIAGLEPFEGKITVQKDDRIGYYPDKIVLPEFLSGYQFLDAVASKADIGGKQRKEVISHAGRKSGLTLRQLRVPVKVYNLYERKRLQVAQALIEKCSICLMDGLFEAFDENNSSDAVAAVKEMSVASTVVITAADDTYAQSIGAQVWYIRDKHLIKGEGN